MEAKRPGTAREENSEKNSHRVRMLVFNDMAAEQAASTAEMASSVQAIYGILWVEPVDDISLRRGCIILASGGVIILQEANIYVRRNGF